MDDVKSVSQPVTIALLGNNYSLQIIETGFTEQFYASHKMGQGPVYLKISASTAQSKTYRITDNPSLFSLPLSFKHKFVHEDTIQGSYSF